MNPGKLIDADERDEHLRLGTHFNPENPEVHFKYPEDQGSFHRAAMRCVGVGECRKTNKGTMCPSYMVTRDEKHSTRGRAHLLFEMMRGKNYEQKETQQQVKESLDLCLACKGCLGECPVNVDMATYKAEFFSQYYKHHPRPRSAYAFGFIDQWAKWGTKMSRITNFITQNPVTGKLMKLASGIAPQRKIPKFAAQAFTSKNRSPQENYRNENTVLLWPDTFNNYFFPEVLKATEEILNKAGFEVILPQDHLCCGRPLYDFGMLDKAKNYLEKTMHALATYIEEGIPFIGLEASCIAVFRNELGNLFPNHLNAQRLANLFHTFPEFILQHWERFPFQSHHQKVLMHRHCHHQAVMGYDADKEVLKKIGFKVNIPDTGCCGLAGSFGFEKGEKYDLSIQAGERKLFPRVNSMEEDYLITDGFSCREQIKHGTGKMPMHTVELLHKAIQK